MWDLARAHVRAVERFDEVVTDASPFAILNLGTGNGTTVRELVAIFESVTGDHVSVVDGPRRPGDVAGAYAVPDRAEQLLGWRAGMSVEEGVRDALAWMSARAVKTGPEPA